MKLYLKRDTSTDISRYIVFDKDCREKYYVVGKRTASGDKMKIIDLQKEVLGTIKALPFQMVNPFFIKSKGRSIQIVLKRNGCNCSLTFHGISWSVRGDVLMKTFDIIDADNTVIASHVKRWSPCGDGYELNINDENREIFCIAAAVCVNLIQTTDIKVAQPL